MTVSPALFLIWLVSVISIFLIGAIILAPEKIPILSMSVEDVFDSLISVVSKVLIIIGSVIVKVISFPKYLRDRFSTKSPNSLEKENIRLREENEQLRSRTNYR